MGANEVIKNQIRVLELTILTLKLQVQDKKVIERINNIEKSIADLKNQLK